MNNKTHREKVGRFNTKKSVPTRSVAVITDKQASGHVGSYAVRTVDSGRFVAAKKAASSALKERKG